MAADGTGERQITNGHANDRALAWSPDRTRLLFSSDRRGTTSLYLMNADGSRPTQLTVTPPEDVGGLWSPDGRTIVGTMFTSQNGCGQIFVMRADGFGQKTLTDSDACNWGPSWSPDGQSIAFGTTRDGNFAIYTMRPNGSAQTRLSPAGETNDAFPVISPDGRTILFTSWDEALDDWSSHVCVMNVDGSGRRQLTANSSADSYPAWSPDGTRIAFQSSRDGNAEIYVMNADGSGQTRLTDNPGEDAGAIWK